MPKGSKLQVVKDKTGKVIATYSTKTGYLLKNGEPVTLPGKANLFVRILEL